MDRIRRRWAAAGVAAAVSLSLAACSTGTPAPSGPAPSESGTPSAEQIEIRATWWGGDSRNNATLEAFKLYEKAHPNVKITSEYSAFSGYFEKIATLSAGGDAPDLMQFQYAYFPQYVANGQLLDLDQYATVLDLSGVDEGLLQQGVVGGKRYAVPAGSNTQAVVYDPAVFADAGVDVPAPTWTWDDFARTAKELVASGKIDFAANDFSGSDQLFDFWLTQRGKTFYTADHKLGFTQEDLVEFWQFFGGLRDQKLLPPVDVTAATTGDTATYPIVTGQAAMDFAFSTLLPGLASTAGRSLAVLPYPNGDQPGQYLIGTGITWTGSANTKHPEVVADIINFLINDPEAVKILGLERGVPITAAGRDAISADLTADQKVMVDYISQVAGAPLATESVFYNDPPAAASEVTGLFKTAMQEAAYGKASVEDAAANLITQAEEALVRAG